MLTSENFKQLVGYQECAGSGPHANAFLMGSVTAPPEDWTKNIPSMTNDDVLDRLVGDDNTPMLHMSLNIINQEVVCDQTLDQVLVAASNLLKSFPTFSSTLSAPFYLNSAKIAIAKNSRRGVGNAQIDNVLVYRGNTEYDCCLAIIKCNELYGIAKQKHFDRYGFILDDGKI